MEGLAWAPVAAAPIGDVYDEFSIALAHASRLPDEFLNTMTLFPTYPLSGTQSLFASNVLPPEPPGGTVVHRPDRDRAAV